MWYFKLENNIQGNLRDWAIDPGSTCSKCKNLAIHKTSTESINTWPTFNISTPGVLRTSWLYIDNQPWMFAQAWTAQNNETFINKLKSNKPLGKCLFNDHIKRSALKFTKPEYFTKLVTPETPIVARHSYFNSASWGSLLLLEVFLQHKTWD